MKYHHLGLILTLLSSSTTPFYFVVKAAEEEEAEQSAVVFDPKGRESQKAPIWLYVRRVTFHGPQNVFRSLHILSNFAPRPAGSVYCL